MSATPSAAEYLARRDVALYFERVLSAGGRVILQPTFPYFGIIPGWRMGPRICVRCGERPVRLPLGRRGRRASTCTVCGHRKRERGAEAAAAHERWEAEYEAQRHAPTPLTVPHENDRN